MNRNNLNWVDNKVFNPGNTQSRTNQADSQARPLADTAPIREMPENPKHTGTPLSQELFPSTYQAPMTITPSQTDVSPATLEAPGTYQSSPSMDLAMLGVPQPSRQPAGMQGTLTRTEAQDSSPFVEGPPTIMSAGYTPAYLRSIIGRRIRAEFIFQNMYLDKTGILREVGISYFVIEDMATHAMVMCDLYSVKFVTSV
jgi:hypothetical protein